MLYLELVYKDKYIIFYPDNKFLAKQYDILCPANSKVIHYIIEVLACDFIMNITIIGCVRLFSDQGRNWKNDRKLETFDVTLLQKNTGFFNGSLMSRMHNDRICHRKATEQLWSFSSSYC